MTALEKRLENPFITLRKGFKAAKEETRTIRKEIRRAKKEAQAAKVESAQSLLRAGVAPEIISKALGIPVSAIQKKQKKAVAAKS